jgi:hypothetical protein
MVLKVDTNISEKLAPALVRIGTDIQSKIIWRHNVGNHKPKKNMWFAYLLN